jgi:hypothetical protein
MSAARIWNSLPRWQIKWMTTPEDLFAAWKSRLKLGSAGARVPSADDLIWRDHDSADPFTWLDQGPRR